MREREREKERKKHTERETGKEESMHWGMVLSSALREFLFICHIPAAVVAV